MNCDMRFKYEQFLHGVFCDSIQQTDFTHIRKLINQNTIVKYFNNIELRIVKFAMLCGNWTVFEYFRPRVPKDFLTADCHCDRFFAAVVDCQNPSFEQLFYEMLLTKRCCPVPLWSLYSRIQFMFKVSSPKRFLDLDGFLAKRDIKLFVFFSINYSTAEPNALARKLLELEILYNPICRKTYSEFNVFVHHKVEYTRALEHVLLMYLPHVHEQVVLSKVAKHTNKNIYQLMKRLKDYLIIHQIQSLPNDIQDLVYEFITGFTPDLYYSLRKQLDYGY
jgi:hypothetical protein